MVWSKNESRMGCRRMIDREKVIKGLEKLRKDLGYGLPDRSDVVMRYLNSLTDAISLLKEQEPMMVRLTTSTIRCPKCGKQITSRGAIHREINFCWKCGQAVKWE